MTPGAIRSRNIFIIASMSKIGMVHYKINSRPVNGDDSKLYMVELKALCDERNIENPLFIMDSARIHHYTGLLEVLDSLNIEIMYLPEYSPFLNPIENVFSKWKNHVIRGARSNDTELSVLIDTGFESITMHDRAGF